MPQTAPTRNVLTTLDERPPSALYWQLTLLATLGGFLFGYDTSNIGSALNFVPYNLHGLALGYLVSGASLGAAAGAIVAGPVADRFGRKKLLIVDAGLYAAGAILSAVTPDVAVLLFARTLIGLAIGADSAIATAYIAEYAPKDRRGSLTVLQQWMITVGILIAYIVALVIFSAFPSSAASSGWRLVLGLWAVPALIGLALRTQMPESPRWLLRHGRYDQVRKVMRILGVGEVSEEEVRRAADVIARVERGQPGGPAPGLDAGGAPRAGSGVGVLHPPADHRDQRAAVLRAEPARAHLLRRARQPRRHNRGRGGGHPDHDCGQRDLYLPGVPLDRQVRPALAGHRRLHGDDRLCPGLRVRSGVPVRHRPAGGHHGRPGPLHRLLRRRLDPAGRGLPDRGPRPGRRVLRHDRLAGQLRPHRDLPRLAERHQPRRRHGLLRRPGLRGHRVRLEVPARDQGPSRRGNRPRLRTAAGTAAPTNAGSTPVHLNG